MLPCRHKVFGEQRFDGVAAERPAARGGEYRVHRSPLAFAEPAPYRHECFLPQRGTALLPAFAIAAYLIFPFDAFVQC